MSDHVTTRFGFTGLDPDPRALEYLNNWPATLNALLDAIDAKLTGYSAGVIARIPTAGTAGRVYLATDDRTSSPNGTLYFDNGTGWVIVPTNNYTVGVIASRPRAGTRGQFYYATDDTTAGANGTLYLFDGTAWNQVQTGGATALSSSLAARVLSTPTAVTSPGSLAANTPRTPNASRPTLVTLLFSCVVTTGAGGGGSSTANVSIDSYSTVGSCGFLTTATNTASIQHEYTVTFLVPAGKAYRWTAQIAGSGSTPTCSVQSEETL